MKLQINENGSWRSITEFDSDRAPEVEDAAALLSRAAGGLRLAVVDDNGERRYLSDRGVFAAISHAPLT